MYIAQVTYDRVVTVQGERFKDFTVGNKISGRLANIDPFKGMTVESIEVEEYSGRRMACVKTVEGAEIYQDNIHFIGYLQDGKTDKRESRDD